MNTDAILVEMGQLYSQIREMTDAHYELSIRLRLAFERMQWLRLQAGDDAAFALVYAALYPTALVSAATERYAALCACIAVFESTQAAIDAALGLGNGDSEAL